MTASRSDTPAEVPFLSCILAYGPVLGILGLAFCSVSYEWAISLGRLFAASILIFLAGVVRGLSFFTEGGPRASQIGIMAWRFLCGVSAFVLPLPIAFAVLAAGYVSSLLYDPSAARTGSAPRYFAQLRPPQMTIALAGIILLFWRSLQT